jgi:hypothetical protein
MMTTPLFTAALPMEPHLGTYNQLTNSADTIYRLLYGYEQALASYADQSRGIILMQNHLPKRRDQRRLEMLGAMYVAVIKNQQTAEYLLKSQTPYFQEIDVPFLPLGHNNILNGVLTIIIFIGSLIFGVLVMVGLAYYTNEIKPLL